MPKKIDLTNKTFGEWTVIREATKEEKFNKPGAYWKCKCSCGQEKIISGQVLRKGESKSCGCKTINYISKANSNKAEDLSGKKYGRLLVLYRDFEYESKFSIRGQTYWKCKCDCGKLTTVGRNNLINNRTKSCGCLRKEIASKHLSEVSKQKYIDETGNQYGKLSVLYKIDNITTREGVMWHCQCECGNFKDVLGIDLRNGTVSSCGCMGISKGEWKINKILKENNVLFAKEYTIKIQDKYLRFDFAIFDNEGIILYFIEFDGPQHQKASELFGGEKYLQKLQINDNLKNIWCKNHSFPLIRIPYKQYDNLSINDLLLETSSFIV